MKLKLWEKRVIFSILVILWLFFIFFVWRTFHPETGKRNFILTTHGVEHFRKWLDVSGWTKLVFKISYDKYEQVYQWSELVAVKSMIEKIVLKNIDNRISALGVSDYKAYTQNMDNNPYIIVEIGGVADLDQAKEIIGKTVELEFRLPNKVEPSNTEKQQRKEMAQKLRDDIDLSEWLISKFAESRWSQNVFYNNITGLSISQLPDIFKNNTKLLDLEKGKISQIIDGLFDVIEYNDFTGNLQKDELYGYTFYRINEVLQLSRDNITVYDIVDISEALAYTYEQKVAKSQNTNIDSYEFVWWDLIYNVWLVAENQLAYDVKIVQVVNNITIGMEDQDLEQTNQQKTENLENVQKNIKTQDAFDEGKLLVDGWVPEEELKKIIADFDSSAINQVKTYSQLATDYVVYLRDIKAKDENLSSQIVVKNVNKNLFEEKMESKTLYDIELVFVQDRETWKTAQSSKWDILNWAYFKFANTSQSQIWLPVVVINFDDKGKEIFCDITSENINNQMAIFIGGEMLTSPVIKSKICGWTAQIDGDFTMDWARELVDSLNNGALPAQLVLMQEEKISPTLWDNALKWSLWAAFIGIIAIFVFIYFAYWRKKSLVTLWVLLSFMIILGWWIKLIDYALSLSGIAAVILSIWMAVDANILIYERKREEEDNWRTKHASIDVAYDRSWPAIRDGNVSTWIIALLLFMLGSNMFKWFGFMLMITVIITLLVNVPLTKMLLKVVYKNK